MAETVVSLRAGNLSSRRGEQPCCRSTGFLENRATLPYIER